MGVWWNMLTIQQLRALNDEQVTARVNDRLAPQGAGGVQHFVQPADFLAAQFYVNELDRRETARVNAARDRIENKRRRVDLALELLIVVLIGVEIVLGIVAGHQQSRQVAKELEAFGNMQNVLANLQQSSQATADSLKHLTAVTETMNNAIQDEARLNYRVAVDVTFDAGSKRVWIVNKGRSVIWLWGDKVGNAAPQIEEKPREITPGGSYYIVGDRFYEIVSKVQKDSAKSLPFLLYLRSENGKPFVVSSQFNFVWQNDVLNIHTQTLSITQKDWQTP
jgi:hypothetical protein